MITEFARTLLHVHKLWMWICVVFVCRWELFKMYMEKHLSWMEKTLGLIQQNPTVWEWVASFGIFPFAFSTALCPVTASSVCLAACWLCHRCPQGSHVLWRMLLESLWAQSPSFLSLVTRSCPKALGHLCDTLSGCGIEGCQCCRNAQHLPSIALWTRVLSARRLMRNIQLVVRIVV